MKHLPGPLQGRGGPTAPGSHLHHNRKRLPSKGQFDTIPHLRAVDPKRTGRGGLHSNHSPKIYDRRPRVYLDANRYVQTPLPDP